MQKRKERGGEEIMRKWLKNLTMTLLLALVCVAAPALVSDAASIQLRDSASMSGSAWLDEYNQDYFFERSLDQGDASWFWFLTPASSNGYVRVTIKNNDAYDWVDYAVCSSDGSQLWTDDCYQNGEKTKEFYMSANGQYSAVMEPSTIYYIKVWDMPKGTHMKFHLEYSQDKNPNGKASAQRINLNQTYSASMDASLGQNTDTDYFVFTAKNSGNHSFKITNATVDTWLDYSIREWNGDEIVKDTNGRSVSDDVYRNNTKTHEVYLEQGVSYYITVSEEHSGNYSISVSNARVSSIKLNRTSKKVEVDKSFTLKASILPKNAYNKSLVWTSSNENVATVNENGKVYTRKAGTAVITASSVDGGGAKGSCKVTVTPKKVGSIWMEEDESSANSIKLKWNTNGEVYGYKVAIYNKKTKNYEVVKTVKKNYVTVTGLKPRTEYKIGIIPYMKKGNIQGPVKSIMTTTLPGTSKITGNTKISQEVSWGTTYVTKRIRWKKVPGVKGYRLLYSSSKNGYYSTWSYDTSNLAGTSAKVRGQKGNRYFFKIQTFYTYRNRTYYGKASKPVKITFK